VTLLFDFLKENKLNIKEINNIFVNQGPGKFSGIRTSISAAKALSFTNKLNLYGFNSEYVKNQNYDKIIDLFNKGHLIKNLIKPQYSS
jgi:tRNA A37 threonylcarbamoyladenosine modification protein TsaB